MKRNEKSMKDETWSKVTSEDVIEKTTGVNLGFEEKFWKLFSFIQLIQIVVYHYDDEDEKDVKMNPKCKGKQKAEKSQFKVKVENMNII